ncbi:uncharacterized protein LOC144533741 [Sander vitreus]
MAQFRWIIMSSFLMLLVHFTAGKYSTSAVRTGGEVTLSCEHVIDDQNKCDSTSWTFGGLRETVRLFERGKISKEAEAKSDRLSVTEKCSLVIKKVTEKDVGSYTCRQFRSGEQQQGGDSVHLSVVTITEQKNNDTVTLICSVLGQSGCRHSVKWLYEGDKTDVNTIQHFCQATATFTTSHLNQKSKDYELLKCEVTEDYSREVKLFPFISPQSSGENPGWWRIIFVPVGLATLITSVVAVNIWTRAKENKTQTQENIEHNDEDEDEDTVNYENDAEASSSV